jgi:SAM-dependent methyltransferase
MNRVFDTYACYYDLLYRDKDYFAEAEYVASCIREYAPRAKRVLELGCGTGAHAEQLARLGYEVHGVDMSEAMLARAEARKFSLPAELAARISFSLGDVRSVRTGETYGAVVSLFHVMSYQTANADIAAALETTAVHLEKGGAFLFDFWYGPAVLTQRPEVRVKRLEDSAIKVTRIAEPVMHTNENVVDVHYTVFVELKATQKVEQIKEQHRMRYLFLPELDQLLENSGFKVLCRYQWMGTQPPDETTWAGFLIAGK